MRFYSRLFQKVPTFDFVAMRIPGYILTAIVLAVSIVSLLTKGLNYGVDFSGGISIEVRATQAAADVAHMRTVLEKISLGEVSLQAFGSTGRDVTIRVQRQEGDETHTVALSKIKEALGAGYEYPSVEAVGPKVGDELKRDGALAVALAILAIAGYVWFRFEWQFGVGALAATFHDVIGTFGLFSLTGLEFNLTSVAAILTIAGYSINDTVVIYDRVRENLRKYKTMPMYDLLNLSVNETLARTLLTVATVFITVVTLLIFGGDVLRGFSIAMLWGLIIGTYSSIFVALTGMIHLNLRGGDKNVVDAGKVAP